MPLAFRLRLDQRLPPVRALLFATQTSSFQLVALPSYFKFQSSSEPDTVLAMADTLCSPSEFKFLWKRRGNPNYALSSVTSEGSFIESLEFADVRNGRRLVGKLVASPKEGEAYHWPRLAHANLNPLSDVVSINERFSVYLSPHVGRTLQAVVHDPAFLLDPRCFERKKAYAEDVLWALDYVHGKSLCLLNLTDAAVRVCDASDRAVLCDFSAAALVERVTREKMAWPLLFQAPEVRSGVRVDPVRAEMWSFGVLALQVFTGHAYPGREVGQVLSAAKGIDYAAVRGANPSAPLGVLEVIELKKFLNLFLVEDPFLRETAGRAALSPFLRTARSGSVDGTRRAGHQAGPGRIWAGAGRDLELELKRQRCDLEFENLYLMEAQRCRDQMRNLPTSNKFVSLGAIAEGGDATSLMGGRKLPSTRKGARKTVRRLVSGKTTGRGDIAGGHRLDGKLTSVEKDFLTSNKPFQISENGDASDRGKLSEARSQISKDRNAISNEEDPVIVRYEARSQISKDRNAISNEEDPVIGRYEARSQISKDRNAISNEEDPAIVRYEARSQISKDRNAMMPNVEDLFIGRCESRWLEKKKDSEEIRGDMLSSSQNLEDDSTMPWLDQRGSLGPRKKKEVDFVSDSKEKSADISESFQDSKDICSVVLDQSKEVPNNAKQWNEKKDTYIDQATMLERSQTSKYDDLSYQDASDHPSHAAVPHATELSEEPANDSYTTLGEKMNEIDPQVKYEDVKPSIQEQGHHKQIEENKLPEGYDSNFPEVKKQDLDEAGVCKVKVVSNDIGNYQNICCDSKVSFKETQSNKKNEWSQNASPVLVLHDQDLSLDEDKPDSPEKQDKNFSVDACLPNLNETNLGAYNCKLTVEVRGDISEQDSMIKPDFMNAKKENESLSTSNNNESKPQEMFEITGPRQDIAAEKARNRYKTFTDQEMFFMEASDGGFNSTKNNLHKRRTDNPVQNDEISVKALEGNFGMEKNLCSSKKEQSSVENNVICEPLEEKSEKKKYRCLDEDRTAKKNLKAWSDREKGICSRKERPNAVENEAQMKGFENSRGLQEHKHSDIIKNGKVSRERDLEFISKISEEDSKTSDLGLPQHEGAAQKEINNKNIKKSHGRMHAYFKRISNFRKQKEKQSCLDLSVSTNSFLMSDKKESKAVSKSTLELSNANAEKKHKMLRGLFKNKWPLFSCFVIHKAKDVDFCPQETKEQND